MNNTQWWLSSQLKKLFFFNCNVNYLGHVIRDWNPAILSKLTYYTNGLNLPKSLPNQDSIYDPVISSVEVFWVFPWYDQVELQIEQTPTVPPSQTWQAWENGSYDTSIEDSIVGGFWLNQIQTDDMHSSFPLAESNQMWFSSGQAWKTGNTHLLQVLLLRLGWKSRTAQHKASV